ncbi:hypothetical protein CAAN1_05S01486 [[Candida] anglica]|uniref:DUF1748-domain-containing protein n=1 Tax=[Candida] anglica TaxID=148631 RepID=A0ABP0ECT5_9ASCO
MIGKVAHYGADLILVSAFLAGVRRNTNLTLNTDSIQNDDIRYYTEKYLSVGESVFDYSSAYFGSSEWFHRK